MPVFFLLCFWFSRVLNEGFSWGQVAKTNLVQPTIIKNLFCTNHFIIDLKTKDFAAIDEKKIPVIV